MHRSFLFALGAAIVTSCAGGERNDPRAVVTRLYETIEQLDISGAPTPQALDSLAPILSTELRGLLRDARALYDADLKRAPDEKPAFAEGDLFTSLFEGHSRFEIADVSPEANGDQRVSVRFTYDPSPPPVTWTDQVILKTEEGRLVVSDVVYGGDWQFANKGTLVSSLRAAVEGRVARHSHATRHSNR
jgi:hypothetical protein